jgi:molybdopterin-biosynthesis enzyme MoeA-like protein
MVATVLPTLTGGAPLMSRTLRIDRGEGDIAGPLGALAAEFSDLSIGSYPFQKDGKFGANIVLRGTDEARLETALSQLKALFAE